MDGEKNPSQFEEELAHLEELENDIIAEEAGGTHCLIFNKVQSFLYNFSGRTCNNPDFVKMGKIISIQIGS